MLAEIEKSLIKTYRKELWSKFVSAVVKYKLISEFDKIAVCISGGKDSFLLAKLMQELKKHNKINFELVFLVINPGYSEQNRQVILDNAKKLGVDIKIFDVNYFEHVASVENGSPCYLCARIRRGVLYSHARELGCNKIALGHHFDDVVETTLLSMLYNGQLKTMMPKLHSQNYEGLELIRPMYYIREKDIIRWASKFNLQFINCACPLYIKRNLNKENESKRYEMKQLINSLENMNNKFVDNIFTSLKNINLNTVIGYEKNGVKHNFLDEY